MAAGCPCSSYLAEYLVRRHPSVGIDEGVVCIGHHAAYLPDLKRAGWKVSELTEKEAEAQYHLAGAPWLVIYDPKGRVRYSGGYLGRMIHSAQDGFLDQAILASLQRGETVTRLGAFGCLTRRSEQRDLDPVGLKYQQARSED